MKKILIVAPLVFIFYIVFINPTVQGYVSWYWRSTKAELLVNGKPAGYVHNGKGSSFATRTDLNPHHSYRIWIDESDQVFVFDCDKWIARDWFVFSENHVNIPCFLWTSDDAYKAPSSPGSKAVLKNDMVEFTTKDGKLIQIRLK